MYSKLTTGEHYLTHSISEVVNLLVKASWLICNVTVASRIWTQGNSHCLTVICCVFSVPSQWQGDQQPEHSLHVVRPDNDVWLCVPRTAAEVRPSQTALKLAGLDVTATVGSRQWVMSPASLFSSVFYIKKCASGKRPLNIFYTVLTLVRTNTAHFLTEFIPFPAFLCWCLLHSIDCFC